MEKNLLNVEQLAAILNVPISWIYGKSREIGPESIPRIKVGKYIRFERDKVLEWLKEQQGAE